MSENVTAAVSEAAPNSRIKITTKDSALTLAHKRLAVLQLAESLGNIAKLADAAVVAEASEDLDCLIQKGEQTS